MYANVGASGTPARNGSLIDKKREKEQEGKVGTQVMINEEKSPRGWNWSDLGYLRGHTLYI